MPDTNLLAPPIVTSPVGSAARTATLGIAAWVGLCILVLFCGAMTHDLIYDEDQYIAAGVMARSLLPYRDFVYLQPPLYPLVLAPVFSLAEGWFVLAARLFSFGLALTSGVLLWTILRRLGAGLLLAMVLVTACLTSPFLTGPLGNARNDGLPLTLMLAGLATQLWAEDQEATARETAVRFLAALLFGLAAEAKLTYLFGPAVLLWHALFMPLRRLGPVLLGLSLAALPAAYCWSEAPDGFRFGVFDYHLAAPAAWYAAAGLEALLTPWLRLETLAADATTGGNLTLLVLAIALALVAMARCRHWQRPGPMLLGLVCGAFVLALLPTPSWSMYFAAIAPLLACCVAHLDRVTSEVAGLERKRILLAVSALSVFPVLLLQVAALPALLDPARWVGIATHRNAEAVRDAVAHPDGEVATLFPTLVIDANPVRPEFASGPFVFRSGDDFGPRRLARLHALSPATLSAAFDADPPQAIYAGRYAGTWQTPMDAPLAAYATTHGWRLVREDAGGGRVWVRP